MFGNFEGFPLEWCIVYVAKYTKCTAGSYGYHRRCWALLDFRKQLPLELWPLDLQLLVCPFHTPDANTIRDSWQRKDGTLARMSRDGSGWINGY